MAHILGVLAVVTFLLSFQFKKRRNIIAVNLISRLLYILQYVFLGAFEGAVLDFMGLLLSYFARYKEKEFILNIANSYNTYGDLMFHTSLITVVRTKKNIHKAKINTNDIIQVEFVE